MSIFPKPKEKPASSTEILAKAVRLATNNLQTTRGVAEEALRVASDQVATAEGVALAARQRFEEAVAAEQRRPSEERLREQRARIAEIDSALRDAFQWLSESFSERESAGLEITLLTAKLGKREAAPPLLEIDPHRALLRSSDAELTIQWPKVATGIPPLR
jgi:hypothetical protein